MSQCKTKADLHREYARVCDLCEGVEVKSWKCVRMNTLGTIRYYFDDPKFIEPPERYQFALAIVEGKPVFPGDLLYNKITGKQSTIFSEIVGNRLTLENWSWNPPQPKKLVLNGVELPMPCDYATVYVTIPFDNIDLENQFRKQFFDLVANQKDSK